MSSQPSIALKRQPLQSLSDTTGVRGVYRSSEQSTSLDNAVSVPGLQIVQDQGNETLNDRDRPVKSRSRLRRSGSHQVTAVQPLAHSVKDAADSINASKGLLYNAIKLYASDPERGLRARKLMGRTVILHSDLMDWLNRLPVKMPLAPPHSERGHQRWAAAKQRENAGE